MPGPQGPIGPAGPTGPAGAPGPSGAVTFTAVGPVSSGTANNITDPGNGGLAAVTLTANTTLTLPVGPTAGGTVEAFTVELVQDGTGGRTVTWNTQPGASIVWSGSVTAPPVVATANAVTEYRFQKVAGEPVWRATRVFYQVFSSSGSQTFTCAGRDQSFTVPPGVSSLTVKLWGAGGGGGTQNGATNANLVGGGGGYSTAMLAVNPGDTYTVIVGCGGAGGSGSNSQGGSGGGRSALRNPGAVEVITAGGGGGASYDGAGGAGGGAQGAQGTHGAGGYNGGGEVEGGHGGSQNAGGAQAAGGCGVVANAPQAGTQFAGGNGEGQYPTAPSYGGGAPGGYNDGGGGGGGGYYGGGGGYCWTGGGGGSGYVPSGGTTVTGSGQYPANQGDADRGTAGTGGGSGANGSDGVVKISW